MVKNETVEQFFDETINKNENLSVIDKESLNLIVVKYIYLFNDLGVDLPIENSTTLLSNLKVKANLEPNLTDKAYMYDFSTNTMIDNRRFVKNGDKRVYDYCIAVLDIISKKYNVETSSYNDGLIYTDEYGNQFGEKINNKLKHELVSLIVGSALDEDVRDFYVDKSNDPCTLEDSLLIDINSVISSEDLLTYFINGEGTLFYQKISSTLENDEKQTKEFFENIDSYTRENSIKNRKKYDEHIKQMQQNKLNKENARIIA